MLASPLQVSPRVSQTPTSLAKDAAEHDQESLSPVVAAAALTGKRSPLGGAHFNALLPKKRLKFSTNYCGLESGLSEMNVESNNSGNGYITPTRVDDLPVVMNANSSRKRSLCAFAASPPALGHARLQDATINTLQKKLSQHQLQSSSLLTMRQCSSQSPAISSFSSFDAQRPLKIAHVSPRKVAYRQTQFFPTPSTVPDSTNSSCDAMDDEQAQHPVSVLRRTFDQRYTYRRRLKQLPSQRSRAQQGLLLSASSSSTSVNSQTHVSPRDKVEVEDALKIFEDMLGEREQTLRDEFRQELEKQLGEQYDQLMRYNEEYVRTSISTNNCSYLS